MSKKPNPAPKAPADAKLFPKGWHLRGNTGISGHGLTREEFKAVLDAELPANKEDDQ